MRKAKSKKHEKSSWEWYGVKLLFACVRSGKPNPETMDEDYSEHKTYEESIILIKAQSYNQAYKLAERKARQSEASYYNHYGEYLEWLFIGVIDAFVLFDDVLRHGTEVYSRFIRTSKDMTTNQVILHYYPEALSKEDQ